MQLDNDGLVPAIRDYKAQSKLPAGCGVETVLADAMKFFLCNGVKIGGKYRHWKGGEYIVTGLSRDTSIWEMWRVQYICVTDAEHGGSRPLTEFLGDVNDERYQGPRFRLIG